LKWLGNRKLTEIPTIKVMTRNVVMESKRALITVLITADISTFMPVSKLNIETVTRISNGKIDMNVLISKNPNTGPNR
jgi:hypothetical protein